MWHFIALGRCEDRAWYRDDNQTNGDSLDVEQYINNHLPAQETENEVIEDNDAMNNEDLGDNEGGRDNHDILDDNDDLTDNNWDDQEERKSKVKVIMKKTMKMTLILNGMIS